MHGLQLVRSYNQPPDIQALVSKIMFDGLIVSVGSAVKCDKRPDSSNDIAPIDESVQPFALTLTHRPVNFSSYELAGYSRSFYKFPAPRAPPA